MGNIGGVLQAAQLWCWHKFYTSQTSLVSLFWWLDVSWMWVGQLLEACVRAESRGSGWVVI